MMSRIIKSPAIRENIQEVGFWYGFLGTGLGSIAGIFAAINSLDEPHSDEYHQKTTMGKFMENMQIPLVLSYGMFIGTFSVLTAPITLPFYLGYKFIKNED